MKLKLFNNAAHEFLSVTLPEINQTTQRMQIVRHLNSQTNLTSCGSISFYLYFHAFILKNRCLLTRTHYQRRLQSPMLTHVRWISAWKWPLCTLLWSLISAVQTVAQGYVWVLNIIPLETLQTLLFHWGLAEGQNTQCFFTPSFSKKGLMLAPLWIMRMNNKQPSVHPSPLHKRKSVLVIFIELSSGCL